VDVRERFIAHWICKRDAGRAGAPPHVSCALRARHESASGHARRRWVAASQPRYSGARSKATAILDPTLAATARSAYRGAAAIAFAPLPIFIWEIPMTDPAAARAFLLAEVEALEPFAFVLVSPAGRPLHVIEVARSESGGLEVRVPGRPRVVPELPVPVRTSLRDRGFKSEDAADPTLPWMRAVDDAAAAVELVHELLTTVFEEKPDVALDIAHASHRAEHEAQQKLAVVRERLERVLSEIAGGRPEQDADGDYLLPMGGVRVTVAPRVSPGGPVIVRVFAITNVGVTVAPALGLFLARLNFGLMFGRFALDAEHSAIWFDETLLGDQLTDEALRFTVGIVAGTADEWDDRLQQMFGGATYHDVLQGHTNQGIPPTKPGSGGYL
jgi:hypothetical protein